MALVAAAQDAPKAEVFGGYSFSHFKFSQPVNQGGDFTFNANGGVGEAAFYPTKHFGLVGEFGGHKISTIKFENGEASVSGTAITYLFGPRVRYVAKGVTPFAQILFGGTHVGDITSKDVNLCGGPGGCTVNNDSSHNAFTMTAEGGIDINVGKHFAFRSQGGYMLTRFEQDQKKRKNQNDARFLVGIVLH